jgi:hypothetical protein
MPSSEKHIAKKAGITAFVATRRNNFVQVRKEG